VELGFPVVANCCSLARQTSAELTITFSEAMKTVPDSGIKFFEQSNGNEIK